MFVFYLFVLSVLMGFCLQTLNLFFIVLGITAICYLIILIHQRYQQQHVVITLILLVSFFAYFSLYSKIQIGAEQVHIQQMSGIILDKKVTDKTMQYTIQDITSIFKPIYLATVPITNDNSVHNDYSQQQNQNQATFELGDIVCLTGIAKKIESPKNHLLFNYQVYATSVKIFYQLYEPTLTPNQDNRVGYILL